MFRTVLSKTLRDYRTPILGWGLGLGFLLLLTFATYGKQFQDAQSQKSILELAQTFTFLGEPVAITTPTGYVTWRILGFFLPTLLSIWALLAGSRLLRGEEERNSLDLVLSTPISRVRFIIEKITALLIALCVIALLIGLGTLAGLKAADLTLEVGRAFLVGLNISLFALFFGSLALLLSQCMGRSTAASVTGALVALSFFMDGAGRLDKNVEWLHVLSPLSYYSQNKPLVASYASHPLAALLLLGLSLLFLGVSIALFARRDVGGFAFSLPHASVHPTHGSHKDKLVSLTRARHDITVRAMSFRELRQQRGTALGWLCSIILYAVWATMITPTLLAPIQTILQNNPVLAKLVSGQDAATNASFIGFLVFQFMPVVVVIFSLLMAVRWAGNLDAGRLELVFSTPVSRQRIFLEHFAMVFLLSLLAPIGILLAVLVGAQLANIAVDTAHIVAASFSLIPLQLLTITFVYALAERVRSTTIIGVFTVYLIIAFLAEFLAPILNTPDWLASLSIFHAYGTPVTDGWNWSMNTILLTIALALLIMGLVQFTRGDIDKGA